MLVNEQADFVRNGGYGDLRNVFIVYESVDGEITRQTCGEPCDLARAVGMLSIAAMRAATGD